jgi:uncharacterized RDD family membrane protein YckC
MTQFWVIRDQRREGPFSEQQILRDYRAGLLKPADRLWAEGIGAPVAVQEVFAQLQAASAPGAPPSAGLALELQPLHSSPATAQADAVASPYRPPSASVGETLERHVAEVRYAGFWVRFGAAFLDNLILVLFGLVVGVVLGVLGIVRPTQLAAQGGQAVFGIGLAWLYYAVQESGSECATWGKRAFHLQVLEADALVRISFLRATGRVFARYISMLPLMIGYLIQPFNAQKRALHDYIAGTVVVVESQYSRLLLGVVIGFNVLVVVGLGILGAIAIPAYQDYTIRARVATIVEEVRPATEAVEDYIDRNGHRPQSLAEAGFPADRPIRGVRSLVYEPNSGVVTVTLGFDPLAGKALLFVPQQLHNRHIEWRCRAGTVNARYLPRNCRE